MYVTLKAATEVKILTLDLKVLMELVAKHDKGGEKMKNEAARKK